MWVLTRLRGLFAPSDAARLRRAVARARLALFAERLWLALWPLAMVAGAFLLYLMSPLPLWLPGWAKALAALAALLAAAWQARHPLSLRWPGEEEALARIEAASGLAHQPLRTLRDELAGPAPGRPESGALWRAHRRRLRRLLRHLRAGWPRSHVPRRDPFAWRNALALALIVALLAGGLGRLPHNWRVALAWPFTAPAAQSLDAWLDPPAYSGKPPLVLAGGRAGMRAPDGPVTAPRGTKLVVRVTGGASARLALYALKDGGAAGEELAAHAMKPLAGEAAHQLSVPLTRSVVAVVQAGGELARWPIVITPDAPPVAELTRPPGTTAAGALVLHWRVADDHGVARLRARFSLAEKQARGAEKPLRFKPPDYAIALNALHPKRAAGKHVQALAAHPWAGLMVTLRLRASDQAGQHGDSRPHRLRLPERRFVKPLARAVIEQRQRLILHPDASRRIAAVLAALLAWPEGIVASSDVYLGVRQAALRLYRAGTREVKKRLVGELWELAVRIEDGDLADAEQALEAARKALQQALRDGASEREIKRLTQRLREAMTRYLQQMARRMNEQARRRPDGTADPNARMVTPRDLQKMLDRIEQLARSGAKDAARRLLAELDSIMKSLQAGRMEPPRPPTPQERALGEVQRMIREQQRLMDETWRIRPGDGSGRRPGQPGQGRPGAGRQGGEDRNFGELARRQGQLRDRLRDMLERLRRGGGQAPETLNRSGESMGGAARALRGARRGRALREQAEALRALRDGARGLARQVARQRQGRGRPGRLGRGRGADPLGRPLSRFGEDFGTRERMVPDERAVERARRILEALRKRANDPARPADERDYIERLLKGLF
ncbi:MAG TPA: TIGR02302 family protein [Thermopetrobacter sp.]|nr:TIGR02302 family protein [Thermopetrobacter sp.]